MGKKCEPLDNLTLCSLAAEKERLSYGKYMSKYHYHPPCLEDRNPEEIIPPVPKATLPQYLKDVEKDFNPKEPVQKRCLQCGEWFVPKNGNQKYCGTDCQYEAFKKRQRDQALRGKEQRYCAICGAPLPLSTSIRILTCSKACSEERKREYEREKNHLQYQKRKKKTLEKGD